MDAPPAKRPREEEPEQPSQIVAEFGFKRGRLWLDDGNVILLAQETGFRIHQSVLTRRSKVFRDMFSLAQPSQSESVEGCPVVPLSDHKGEVTHMLLALYDGNRCVFTLLTESHSH